MYDVPYLFMNGNYSRGTSTTFVRMSMRSIGSCRQASACLFASLLIHAHRAQIHR